MKKLSFKFFIIGMLAITAFTPGLFATFDYSFLPVEDKNIQINNSLTEFYYKPEEILPGDDDATELHENHYNLIVNIVDHASYGLNSDSKPIVRNLLLSTKGLVYSGQKVSGGNLKHMLLNTNDVEKLAFVVEYVSDTEFAAYTFSGVQATYDNMDNFIEVYKTQILYENGEWEAVRSFMGKAKVFRPGVVSVSIDVTTWIKT